MNKDFEEDLTDIIQVELTEEDDFSNDDYLNSDIDGDGLSNCEEMFIYGTEPLDPDTDQDTYLDGEEVENNYDPLGPGKLFETSFISNVSQKCLIYKIEPHPDYFESYIED